MKAQSRGYNHGRVALVTGGAQGIGAAAAHRLLEEGFSSILLVDRDASGLAAQQATLTPFGQIDVLAGDLLDVTLPARAVDFARGRFGRLDVVVSAAGSSERCGLDNTTPEAFDRLFGINVRAPLLLMQEAMRLMRPQRRGTIINIGSMLAYGGPPDLITYGASKSALAALTKGAANAVKREGIRMFTINLGWTATTGEHKVQTTVHGMPQDWAEQIGRRMPAGRLIAAEDVAGLIAFLTSPDAQMMTGAVIDYEQMPAGPYDSHPALGPA